MISIRVANKAKANKEAGHWTRQVLDRRFLSLTLREMPGSRSKSHFISNNVALYLYLDQFDLHYGDDFEEEILKAVDLSSEQLILLTPWSKVRPYIWMEMGAFRQSRKRIVVVLYGLTSQEIVGEEGIPVSLKKIHLLELNEIDLYFDQLRQRVLE